MINKIGKTYPFEYANENCVLEDAIYISVFGISNINDLYEKLLKKHKYLPEGMEDAVKIVMTQCELWTDNQEFNIM